MTEVKWQKLIRFEIFIYKIHWEHLSNLFHQLYILMVICCVQLNTIFHFFGSKYNFKLQLHYSFNALHKTLKFEPKILTGSSCSKYDRTATMTERNKFNLNVNHKFCVTTPIRLGKGGQRWKNSHIQQKKLWNIRVNNSFLSNCIWNQ